MRCVCSRHAVLLLGLWGVQMIITPEQMVAHILKLLEDVTKDIPAEKRGESQANILNAFGAKIFQGPDKKV